MRKIEVRKLVLKIAQNKKPRVSPSPNMHELGNQTGRKTTLPQYTNQALKNDSDNLHETMKINPSDYPSQKLRSLK